MYKIMLVDDENHILNALSRLIRREKNWECETYSDPHSALKRATTSSFDVFVSDYRMPQMDGISLIKAITKLQPHSLSVILTGQADLQVVLDAINDAHVFRFICKPWINYDLLATLSQALELRRYQEENRLLADQLREQRQETAKHRTALQLLEEKHPGLTKVHWGPDDSIIPDE